MSTKALAICGYKQGGKSSLAEFLLRNRDELFGKDATIGLYAFADKLKELCMDLFGLSKEQCFGDNQSKNTKTEILWENMPHYQELLVNKTLEVMQYPSPVKVDWSYAARIAKGRVPSGPMTAREVLQCVGTEVMRRIKSDVWVKYLQNKVVSDNFDYAFVTDTRFPNEADAIKEIGGKVLRFLRRPFVDYHISEIAMDKYKCDALIDNRDMSEQQKNEKVLEVLQKWGWLA